MKNSTHKAIWDKLWEIQERVADIKQAMFQKAMLVLVVCDKCGGRKVYRMRNPEVVE
jgi:hypothetical protein